MQPASRNSYDTAVKHLYRKGLENAIPHSLRIQIPRTNKSRWCHEPDDKYQGHSLNQIATAELKLLQAFAANQTAKQMFRAWCRIALTISGILAAVPQVQAKLRNAKRQIVEAVEAAAASIPKKPILRFLDLSRGTYQAWKAQVLHQCGASPFSFCLKVWPQQSTKSELNHMREMLHDPQFATWPVRSVAWFALRTEKVKLSVKTWYKYARMLGISQKVSKKSRKRESLRASAPNQAWHADVTIIKTLDGIKHYCYLVVDNFSRKILAWRVSRELSANIRVATLREAAKPLIEANHTGPIDLVVDGGSENNNSTVEAFISDTNIPIHKLVALRDVHFSNSIVEAVNKVVKYRYLFPKNIPDGVALEKAVTESIADYNDRRPHGSLDGLTPTEAYQGIGHESLDRRSQTLHTSEKLKAAQKARIEQNKKDRCLKCRD